MNAIILHWLTVVALTEAGAYVLGVVIRYLAEYVYTDDGLVASTQPERLNKVFDVLTDLFDQVVLRTSTRKTLSM